MTDGGLHFGEGARVQGDAFTGGKHVYNYNTIYNTVLRGPDELPTRYDSRVQNFLEYYLGTAERPAPFGGRSASLALLDAWLADPAAAPYALLAAPAGRGKSGLLAHWMAQLGAAAETGATLQLVYFPISVRFNTHTETVVFASLAARLAHLHGEKVSPLVDAQQYRGLFADYLRRPLPGGSGLLVLLDGLDEAGGWEAGADLFPLAPPPHLRVLAAARLMAGDPDGSAWLARLGWDAPGLAQRLRLDALDRIGVADVVEQVEILLPAGVDRKALTETLYRLSEGDPLLVRLYLEALVPQGSDPPRFTPSDLDGQKPGLKNYLDRWTEAHWIEEQLKLWGAVDPQETLAVQGLLDACATARGPLQRDDLLALDPALFSSGPVITRALRPLRRLIIGDGDSGYVFSHPRLAEFYANPDQLSEKDRRAWAAKYLAYGASTLKSLADSSSETPAQASPYLLQYYGAHLEAAQAPSAEIYALLAHGWLLAHEAVLGTPAGFLDDARRAARRAAVDGPAALGQQVRAALSFASLAAMGSNIPPGLLRACAEAGVLSPAAALVLARQKSSLRDRVLSLAGLAAFQPAARQAQVLQEAFQAAELIGGWDQGDALWAIISELPRPAPTELTARLLDAARTWGSVALPAGMLAKLASRLAPKAADPILREALGLARAHTNPDTKAGELLSVAAALPEPERLAVVREAWQLAQTIEEDQYRAAMLGRVARQLPPAEQPAALQAAFDAALAVESDYQRAQTLLKLAAQLPAELGEQIRGSLAAEYQRTAGQPHQRIKGSASAQLREDRADWAVLLELYAPFLPETDIRAALEQAWSIDAAAIRVQALAAIAARLPPAERRQVLLQAIATTNTAEDEDRRVWALKYLLEQLPSELVPDAAEAVRAIAARAERSKMLARLAGRLPLAERAPLLAEALAAARAPGDEADRVSVLAVLSDPLAGAQREAVLASAWQLIRTMPVESRRLDQYGRLAGYHPPETVLAEMLDSLAQAHNSFDRSQALATLAPYLSDALLLAALAVARGLDAGFDRVTGLLALAPRLPAEAGLVVYREALSEAGANEYATSRAEDLVRVAQAAPTALLPDALAQAAQAVRALSHEHLRAGLFTSLSQLAEGPEQRKLLAGALSAASAIPDETVRRQILEELAPLLPDEFVAVAVDVALGLQDSYDRDIALAALAPRSPESASGQPPSIDTKLGQSSPEPEPLAAAAEHLAAIPGLLYSKERVEALTELMERLPAAALSQALRVLWTCADRRESLSVLRGIVERWGPMGAAGGLSSFAALTGTLEAYGQTPRPHFLAALEVLAPIIAEVGGQPALLAAAQAVVEAGEWWG